MVRQAHHRIPKEHHRRPIHTPPALQFDVASVLRTSIQRSCHPECPASAGCIEGDTIVTQCDIQLFRVAETSNPNPILNPLITAYATVQSRTAKEDHFPMHLSLAQPDREQSAVLYLQLAK